MAVGNCSLQRWPEREQYLWVLPFLGLSGSMLLAPANKGCTLYTDHPFPTDPFVVGEVCEILNLIFHVGELGARRGG